MSTIKLSQLPAASSVSSSDILPVVHGGATQKATIAQLLALAPAPTSLGGKVIWCVKDGSYATLQAAVDAAAANDTILVGPKDTSWGDVTFPGDKALNVVGLGAPRNTIVEIGKVIFAPQKAGNSGNINQNEVYLENLFINGNFTGAQGVKFGTNANTDAKARLRLVGCFIYNTSASIDSGNPGGDLIVSQNGNVDVGAGTPSLYIDNCLVQCASANTTSTLVNHVRGYTYIRPGCIFEGGKHAMKVAAGNVDALNSTFTMNGAREAVRIEGGVTTMGYCTISNSTANGSGAHLAVAGATLGAGVCTFAVATGTGYAINGVAGTYFLYSYLTLANSAVGAYNVKIKNAITALPVTTTLTSAA